MLPNPFLPNRLLHNSHSPIAHYPQSLATCFSLAPIHAVPSLLLYNWILNRRFTASITYQDALHGFRAGRGTGTATLEAKLLQQLAALREEVLYVIFLDLHKVYDALDRSRCPEILEGYGVGS